MLASEAASTEKPAPAKVILEVEANSITISAVSYTHLSFVMSQIQIDMVWFTARLLPLSYVLSVVLTFLAAVLVDRCV